MNESILTTFERSVVFRGSWGSGGYWLQPQPKTEPPLTILVCQIQILDMHSLNLNKLQLDQGPIL